MTFRLSFRQSRVLKCLKRIIVILDGRMTGKSYTAKMFAIKHLLEGENVIFLTSVPKEAKDAFSNIGTILRNQELNERLVINFACHSIIYGNARMDFTTPDKNFENIVVGLDKHKPCVVVADNILDIPQLLCQISYLENRYTLEFKKILITGTPVVNGIRNTIKSISNKIKIFVWKSEVL